MADFYDIDGNPGGTEVFDLPRKDADSNFAKAKRETVVADSTVSTVWLGLDHSHDGGPPLIFETLVFGGGLDQEMERYSTLEQAHAGHEDMVFRVAHEADVFKVLVADAALVEAVRFVRQRLEDHATKYDIYDYDAKLYQRLVDAVDAEPTP